VDELCVDMLVFPNREVTSLRTLSCIRPTLPSLCDPTTAPGDFSRLYAPIMPIHALPESSSLQLSSGQVLLDPASVVKELVDNAIDASAKSIFIEISPNTLDVIQVRDNGHAVHPDDRGALGKRFCTSKIRTIDDLADLGGHYLGFRGEALNSLIQLAESVEMISRIEGEPTAIKLHLNKDVTSS
jgi:DNA mismatch repair ATPase MutL